MRRRMSGLWMCAALVTTPNALAADDAGRVATPEAAYLASHRTRLFLGMGFGTAVSYVRADDSVEEDHSDNRLALELGVSHPFGEQRFGIHALGRVGTFGTAYSDARDELRGALDLGVGPFVWFETRPRKPNIQYRIAVPVGLTRAWLSAGEGRAVKEEYTSAFGLFANVVGGVDLSWEHAGVYADLSYGLHVYTTEHRQTLRASPSVTSRTDESNIDHQVLLIIGYSHRL